MELELGLRSRLVQVSEVFQHHHSIADGFLLVLSSLHHVLAHGLLPLLQEGPASQGTIHIDQLTGG